MDLFFKVIPSGQNETNATVFEVYYERSFKGWTYIYNESTGAPFMAVFVFLANKFSLYSWNYGDLLIAVFSRALYYKFKRLNEVVQEKFVNRNVAATGIL